MNFDITKCKFMSICPKLIIDFEYAIHNNILSRVTEFNDLVITITTNLSWCENVKNCFIKSPFYDRNDKTFLMLIVNYIWPMSQVFLGTAVRCGVPLMLKT